MPRTRPPYSPEFRRQMVDLVRAGRNPDDLAREFEPSGHSISSCGSSAIFFQKPWPGLLGRPARCRPALSVHEREPGRQESSFPV